VRILILFKKAVIINNNIINFFLLLLTYSGLCTILRSEAGGQDEAIARGCEDDPAYRNNAHLVDDGDLSNHVGYYDAAALYPSSGE
jgi:hypothetical protein